jgi:hypothetical protein
MEKEFVPYEIALALKELGFDEPCSALFFKDALKMRCYCKNSEFTESNLIAAPTHAQAFKWFDKNYDLTKEYGVFPHHTIMLNYMVNGGKKELAESECLKTLIEIVKNK